MISSISLFLAILLAPLYDVTRFKVGPFPSTLLEALIFLTIFSFLIEKLVNRDSLKKWWQRLSSPLTYPAFALLLVGALSIVISPSHYQAIGLWRAYIVEPILVYFILLVKLRENTFAKQLLVAWFGSAIWISGLAIFQRLSYHQIPISYFQIRAGRPQAVFNSANDVALFVGPLAALSVAIARSHKILIVIILLLFSAVWISGSRGGELALGSVEILLLLAFLWRMLSPHWRKLSLKIFLGIVTILTILAAVLFFNLGNYQAPPKEVSQRPFIDTEIVRVCLWQGTRNLLFDHPIFGVGLNGFSLVYPRYHTCDSENFQYPHNIFLNIWSELGLAGLAIFAWIYWITIQLIIKSNGHWIAKTSFLGALLYSLIHGLVDVPYFKNDLSLEFWLLLAAIAAFKENKLLTGKKS
jgi:O-antigen ligase